MKRKVRLIWDFWGPRAQGTAEHQRIHLDEFTRREALSVEQSGASAEKDGHWTAWMIVEETEVDRVRKALRPTRGVEERPGTAEPNPR